MIILPRKPVKAVGGACVPFVAAAAAKLSEKLPDKWKPRGTCKLFSTHGSLPSRGEWGEAERGPCVFLSAEGLNREPVVVDAFVLSLYW